MQMMACMQMQVSTSWIFRVAVRVDEQTALASGSLLERAGRPPALSLLALPPLTTSAWLRGEACVKAFGQPSQVIAAPVAGPSGEDGGAVLVGIPALPLMQDVQCAPARSTLVRGLRACTFLAQLPCLWASKCQLAWVGANSWHQQAQIGSFCGTQVADGCSGEACGSAGGGGAGQRVRSAGGRRAEVCDLWQTVPPRLRRGAAPWIGEDLGRGPGLLHVLAAWKSYSVYWRLLLTPYPLGEVVLKLIPCKLCRSACSADLHFHPLKQ